MDQLCTPDILWGPQSTATHSNLPDKGPIQYRIPDFSQDTFDEDHPYMFPLFEHFHNIVSLPESHIEFDDHPY